MIKLFDKKESSFGLALGGGAARGFAHLGVFEVLERENLIPSFVAGIFEPVPYFDGTLVDGGVLDNLPTETVRTMGADYVLAVDLTEDLSEHENPVEGIVEIIFSSIMLMMEKTGSVGRDTADLLVSPQLTSYSFHDMDSKEEMIQKGREAMEESLPKLKEDLKVT